MTREDASQIPAAVQNSWNEEIHAEQVKQVYSLAPLGFIATIINSLIIFFVMKDVMPDRMLFAWLTAIILVTIPRIVLVLKFRRSDFDPTAARTWEVLLLTGLAGSGVVWGSIGVFPFSGISLAHQVFIAFVLGGMAAGAAATFSALKEGYPAYSIPALTPLAIRFFLTGDAFHLAMGGMLSLYGLLLWRVSRHNYKINRTSLLMRFEHRDMVDSLKAAKGQLLEEIAAKLEAEAELRAHQNQLERTVEKRTADLVRTNQQLQSEIIERKQAEEFLRQSEDRLTLAQKAGRVGFFDMDLVNMKIIWTEQMEQLFGLPPGGFEGGYRDWARRIHHDDLPLLKEQFRKWIKQGLKQIEFEYRFVRADGATRWMSAKAQLSYLRNGRPERMIGTNVDITERKRLEEEIMHMAHHDILTGLPNRRLFMDIMNVELAQARRNRKKLALLFLDLDRFKEVNDTFGHEAGDELLKEVSKRIRTGIRESDSAARIGGDEFNIILSDINRAEDAIVTVRKIIDSLKTPFKIAGYELHITTSIGITIYPDDSTETDTLFRYADIAMYHAKESGRNTFQFYNPEINIRSFERIRYESYLRQAVNRGELVVYYQPQIDLNTRRIVCAEALVRWKHPDLGFLEPKRFIPIAEEIGFIATIDDWVLRTACKQVRRWMDAGLVPVCITVNLSARQFQSPDLADKVSGILKETGMLPDYLDVEITESMAMRNIGQTVTRLEELANMGVHISIDDFGTGFSSLNYLKRLPIQKLKIDQSFIRDLATDAHDRAIIKAVTSMAHSMKMTVIAEGVETEDQLSFLIESDCDEAQGYLFSRPLPEGEFEKLLAA